MIPFFSINVSEFMLVTAPLSTIELGAFTPLLIVAAASPTGSLPDDDEKLARIARVSPKVWRDIRPRVAPLFIVADGQWTHAWIQKEREFIARTREKRTRAANIRWQAKVPENNESGHAHASDMHMQTECKTMPLSPSLSPSQDTLFSNEKREPAKPKRRKPEIPFPEDDTFKDRCRQSCIAKRPDLDFDATFRRFRNNALKNDRRCRDWFAAWDDWLEGTHADGKQHHQDRPGGHRAGNAIAAARDLARDPE